MSDSNVSGRDPPTPLGPTSTPATAASVGFLGIPSLLQRNGTSQPGQLPIGTQTVLLLFSKHESKAHKIFTNMVRRALLSNEHYIVIYVSQDDNALQFNIALNSLPHAWFAVPFTEQQLRASLFASYAVQNQIPSLTVFDAETSRSLTTHGVHAIMDDAHGRFFPWRGFQAPTFALDELKHSQPMPGAVWRDRFFHGVFSDQFQDSTDMEGGDRKKGGGVSGLLTVMSHVLSRVRRDHTPLFLPQPTMASAVDDVTALLASAIDLAKQIEAIKTAQDFAQFLFNFRERLHAMNPGEKLLIPQGWRNTDGGHLVMHTLHRVCADSFRLATHNTGDGIAYHSSSSAAPPKMHFLTTVAISDIPKERVLDDGFWYFFFKIVVSNSDDHRKEMLYEVLLPHLTDRPLSAVISSPLEAKQQVYTEKQAATVNYTQSILEAVRANVTDSDSVGAEAGTQHTDLLFFGVRYVLFEMAEEDMRGVLTLLPSDQRLLDIATQQVARLVLQIPTPPSLLDKAEVHARLLGLRDDACGKVAPGDDMPLLQMSRVGEWAPFSDFTAYVRSENTEVFAGWKQDAKDYALLDFCPPSLTARATDLSQALAAIRACDALCEQLARKQRSSFYRITVIERLFTEILPLPLPDGVDQHCMWQTAAVTYEDQLSVLRLVHQLARHFASAARSVQVDYRSFQSAHTVVFGCIVAITDALIRVQAVDAPSMVSLVLNGTEYSRPIPKQEDETQGDTPAMMEDEEEEEEEEDMDEAELLAMALAMSREGAADASTANEEEEEEEEEGPEKKKQKIEDGVSSSPTATFFSVPRSYPYTVSLSNGGGYDFASLTSELLLTEPGLCRARGAVLEYFQAQGAVGNGKSVFSFPAKMNCTTYLGKEGPTLELVKQLCLLLGYELTPDDKKDKTLDDKFSFIEAATWYLLDAESPLQKNQPELSILRDIVLLYKLTTADVDHRRSVKLAFWPPEAASLSWNVKEVNRAKSMADINVQGFEQLALMVDSKATASVTAISHYIPDVKEPSEDDVLHLKNVPLFSDTLSPEDSERLLSYLSVPYIRLPLFLDFFASKDHVSMLVQNELQQILEGVLFEPQAFVSDAFPVLVHTVPTHEAGALGTCNGVLLNELQHAPSALLSSFFSLLKHALSLDTGSYESSGAVIILFVVRVAVRLESFLVDALAHVSDEKSHEALSTYRLLFREVLLGGCKAVLSGWEAAAQAVHDLPTCCTLNAHLLLLYKNPVTMTEAEAKGILGHLGFLQAWYSPGLGQDGGRARRKQRGRHRGARMMQGLRNRLYGIGGGDEDEDDEEVSFNNSQDDDEMSSEDREENKTGEEEEEEEEEKDEEEEKGGNHTKKRKNKKNKKKKKEGIMALVLGGCPDEELFSVLHNTRAALLAFFQAAPCDIIDNVMQHLLRSATRSHSLISRNWNRNMSDAVYGLFSNEKGDITVDVQTAEVFFLGQHMEP